MEGISAHAPAVPPWTHAQIVVVSVIVAGLSLAPAECRPVPARDASRDPRPPGTTLLYEDSLDANVAGVEDFETLPGIGPAKAAALVAARDARGGFCGVDEVRRASGVGGDRWDAIAALIRVTPSPRCSSSSRE